jgi:integrase/recombinase XerD
MPERSSRQERGPLPAGLAGDFRARLAGQGFSGSGTRRHLRLMADLGEWLAVRGLGPAAMTEEVIGEFAGDRRREGRDPWTPAGLAPLLGFLRDSAGAPAPGIRPAPGPASPEEALLARFEHYLVSERALTPGSARVYAAAARAFAGEACLPGGGVRPVTAPQVTKFIMAESARRSVRGARMTVTAVRALLRWLHQCGALPSDLSGAVPGVAPWSGRRAISPPAAGQVSAVLAACGQAPRTGARDFAIVLMLARYGLRKSEVAALRLEDIDWRSGKITIRGKRSHTDTLPLTADIGEALAGYLAGVRRPGSCRALFLSAKAPARPLAAGSIGGLVRNACLRAGVPPFGPHRLRHFTGTGILEAGGTLAEAGQLLRHSRPATTSLYLSVSTAALRPLARPWPLTGGAAS